MAVEPESPKKKTWSRKPKPKRFRVYFKGVNGQERAVVIQAGKVTKTAADEIKADSNRIQFPEAITNITQEIPVEA